MGLGATGVKPAVKLSLAPSTQTDTPGCQQTVSSCLPDRGGPAVFCPLSPEEQSSGKAHSEDGQPALGRGRSLSLPQLGVLSRIVSGDMAVNQARCPPSSTCFSPLEGDEPRFWVIPALCPLVPTITGREGRHTGGQAFSNLHMQVAQ